MNPIALAQSQNFLALLQALTPATADGAAQLVEAKLLALGLDGTASAEIAGRIISLQLAGPQARAAALQPGATLILQLTADDAAGDGATRATLIEIRPPGAPAIPVTPPRQGIAEMPAAQPLPNGVSRPEANGTLPQTTATASPQPATATEARVAAGPMLAAALHNQDSLAPLLANLRGLANGAVALTLPHPLLRLAERVLAQALPGEGQPLSAPALRQAVQQSGLFHEAAQKAATAQAPEAAAAAQPRSDLKAQLTALREGAALWVTTLSPKAAPTERQALPAATLPAATLAAATLAAATSAAATDPARPPAPRRDAPLAAQPIAEPSLGAGDKPLLIAETLLRQSDAALDRLKLAQFASLPPDPARPDAQLQPQRWLVELPLAFQNGVTMLPLEIEREAPQRDAQTPDAPAWHMRFALDVEPLGPLQGAVSLRGRAVGVTLWAEREPTTRLLRGAAPGLEAALIGAEFDTGGIEIRTGQPATRQATAGQFFDRTS